METLSLTQAQNIDKVEKQKKIKYCFSGAECSKKNCKMTHATTEAEIAEADA